MRITIARESLELLPEKALFWPAQKLLAVTDIHIGKAEGLQAQGIPIPSGAHQDDLKNLENLIQKTEAERILILGDLIHAKKSWTPTIHQDLLNFFELFKDRKFTLLVGNHEKGSLPQLQTLPLEIKEEDLHHGPFTFCHGHKVADKNKFQIQGHVHPVVNVRFGSTRLRLPCFVQEKQSLTLPSFGTLTGGFEVKPTQSAQIFVVAPKEVFRL